MWTAMGIMLCLGMTATANFMQQGNEAYQAGKFGSAIGFYKKALRSGENPSLAYFNLGNCYYQSDSISQAIVCYRSSLTEAPDFFRAYLNLGILYFGLEEMSATVAVLERARPLEPDNVQLLMVLAAAYRNLHEYSQAIPLLEQVVELDSTMDESYFLLYDMVRGLGDPMEARTWLERYPESGRRVADKYLLLAELEEELSGAQSATYFYTKAVEVAPKRKWGYYHLVNNLHRAGNTLVALRKAEEALEMFPKFRELALLAGNLAFEAKYSRRAEQFYRTAYNLGSAGGLVGLQNLVRHYERVGDERSVGRINRFLISMH
jgi:tetratricopeptide (TPR) repeat protein